MEAIKATVRVDTRIFPENVIDRTIYLLQNRIYDVAFEEEGPHTVLTNIMFFDMGVDIEELEELFYGTLIGVTVFQNAFGQDEDIQNYFAQTVYHVTAEHYQKVSEHLSRKFLRKGVFAFLRKDESAVCVEIDSRVYPQSQVAKAFEAISAQCNCILESSNFIKSRIKIFYDECQKPFELAKNFAQTLSSINCMSPSFEE